MRSLGVLSILLLGVAPLTAHAGNYVAQNSYGGADVVVNMDVLSGGGAPAPVLQQPQAYPLPPLRPPVLQRPVQMNAPMAQPMQLRPPLQAAAPQQAPLGLTPPMPRQAPAPMMQQALQQAPAPIAQAPTPAPIMAAPPASMPMPIASPSAPLTTPPVMMAAPQPFSTRELAASAEPLPPIPAPAATPVPSPIAEAAPVSAAAPVKTYAENPIWDTPPVLAKKEEPKKEVAKKAEAKKEDPIWDAAPVVVKKEEPKKQENNPARQLLAQAREEAGEDDLHQERQVVLFDNPPPAPAAEAPLKQVENKKVEKKAAEEVNQPSPIEEFQEPAVIEEALAPAPMAKPAAESKVAALKPQALPEPIAPAPLKPVSIEEKAVAKTETLKPAPITDEATIAEPMAIVPANKVAAAPAPIHTSEKVAMLTPAALPDVAPASIPDSASMKKAETVVDDFEAYRLLFAPSSPLLQGTEQEVLDGIVTKLKSDENIKLQLRAYAGGTPDSSTQARRLSLSRALTVRSYLVQKGITASRMDVRALGIGSTAMGDTAARAGTPADRVDLIFTR